MKYYVCIICLFFYSLYGTFANEVVTTFQKYTYRTVFVRGNENKGYKYHTLVFEEGKDNQNVQVMVSPQENAVIIFVKNKLQKLLFLRRYDSNNSWMISNKARKAIKITAGRNVVSNYNVEDLTSANFKSDYSIEEVISKEEVMLKSLNRKPAFPYVSLRKIDEENFIARYYSANKKPIKEIRYRRGTVDGYTFWSDFSVVDLVYKNIQAVQMKTLTVASISVPQSLFYPNTMQRFFTIFK